MIELRLKAVLEEKGKTAYWLSKQTGISPSSLWRIKEGKTRNLRYDTLEKFCEALGVQPGDLLVYTPNKPKAKHS